MKTTCPSCGAEIEFRYDDSFVRVCSYCRAAVARTDRGIETLGKVADLVPMESPLRLFADGYLGNQSFILVGMAQLRHAAGGLTQEWYAKFSGSWGWLAEAQGRYYMTFEVEGAQLPPLESLSAGSQVQLPTMLGATRTYTVAEIGAAKYVAANGELPFKLVPEGFYRFVDLADGEGNFATIDYGGSGDTPTLYVGQQVTLADLHITGGEIAPPGDAKISSTRLACPNCNAPIDLRAPEQSLRVACAYCSHVLDLQQGALRVLEKLQVKADPRIPLGSTGKFAEGEMIVIGYVQRCAEIEGDWYPFDEYLLYEPSIGFRWLVCSDGHWSYVQPVAGGAEMLYNGVRYEGVKFRTFQAANLRVETVVGEFYWQVKAGETVLGEDYVAPPAMLSRESTDSEENWSLSTYMKPSAIQEAFGNKDLLLPSTVGVAPNQPDPTHGVASILTLAFLALVGLGIVFAATAPKIEKYSNTSIVIPAAGTLPTEPPPEGVEPAAQPNVFFSEPFTLDGGKNIELRFNSALSNDWAYVVASLVNVASGDVVTVDAAMEHYSGVEDGESWSEGSPSDREVVGPVPAGQYVLRLESQHGGATEVGLSVVVRQGVFRARYLGLALAVLGLPFLIFGIWSYSVEKRRWSNSTTGSMPKTPFVIMIAGIVLVLGGIVAILKAIAESSSDN